MERIAAAPTEVHRLRVGLGACGTHGDERLATLLAEGRAVVIFPVTLCAAHHVAFVHASFCE